MQNNQELKNIVQKKYTEIAISNQDCGCSCCGTGTSESNYTIMSDDYSQINGYYADADLGLGCGLPTEFAHIEKGQTILDLGSGAGNDAFIARRIVGDSGRVIGLDFTDAMLEKAKANCKKLGYTNVEFIKGDIENMPVNDNEIDIVISNCVLNLVPDKKKAFSEIFRVLKPGGHFCVSDIIVDGELPENIKNAATMYAGCVSGAISTEEYIQILGECDFANIFIPKKKAIVIPENILKEYLSEKEIKTYKESKTCITSITVIAFK